MGAVIRAMRFRVRCDQHPTYRGIRKPRVNCPECNFIYRHSGEKVAGPITVGK